MNWAIRIDQLGKKYKRYHKRWGRLAEWVTNGAVECHQPFWAIRNISAEIAPGEAFAIVGQNGAGKSTLLKILAGTAYPTEGRFEVRGRMAALLELGMGFHPDFTGRQNAVMGSQILGLSSAQARSLVGEIRDFSELGDYFDQPLRVYSSGMQMRLAFSVATAVRPDVLIVDEAMAVGDAYFGHKCVRRIRRFMDAGTTLLFVSHDVTAVTTLCERAMLLADGRMLKVGSARDVVEYYRTLLVRKEHELGDAESPAAGPPAPSLQAPPEDGELREHSILPGESTISDSRMLESVCLDLLDGLHRETNMVVAGERLRVRVTVTFKQDMGDPHVGFGINNCNGLVIYEANTYTLDKPIGPARAHEPVTVEFEFPVPLYEGHYSVMVGVANEGHSQASFRQQVYFEQKAKVFHVLSEAGRKHRWGGVVNVEPVVRVIR